MGGLSTVEVGSEGPSHVPGWCMKSDNLHPRNSTGQFPCVGRYSLHKSLLRRRQLVCLGMRRSRLDILILAEEIRRIVFLLDRHQTWQNWDRHRAARNSSLLDSLN